MINIFSWITKNNPPQVYGGRPRHKNWAKFREEILNRDNYTCQFCNSNSSLQVHHYKPYHIYPHLELEENNCVTLCMSKYQCHILIGHFGDWNRINPFCYEWICQKKSLK